MTNSIHAHLLFQNGNAEEAIRRYADVFDDFTIDEMQRCFEALSEGGDVMMPPDDYGFSRRYSQLTDRFGVPWALNLA